jgi:hypothetical protein
MPKGIKVLRAPSPQLADFWGVPFCRPGVQEILKELRAWDLPREFVASYIHHAYSAARAFAERPQKYHEEALFFLTPWQWKDNGWFFRLCAAICEANANPTVTEKIIDAAERYSPRNNWEDRHTIDEAVDVLLKDFEIKTTRSYVAKVLHKERKKRSLIEKEWETWHPQFWRPCTLADLECSREWLEDDHRPSRHRGSSRATRALP